MPKRKANEATDNSSADQVTDDVGAFPPEESQADETQTQRKQGPVRSWSERFTGGLRYQVLTDSRINKIVIKFKLPEGEKTPPEEVLAVMRAAKVNSDGSPTGLRFEDSRLHGKIWTLPNDTEGRALLASIQNHLEKLATETLATQEPAR
ncbi:MAG TPA: hypothetical protein VE988_10255 [Gemmataceae bacterium]|nr:hypothetical protein [Gemmataceae bacterium]